MVPIERGDRRAPEDCLSFLILGQRVRIACADQSIRSLVQGHFQAMANPGNGGHVDLAYRIDARSPAMEFTLVRDGCVSLECQGYGDLLYLLEQDLTVELQKRRSDLLFLHSAAIDWQGKACLLVAESGSGKSATTWGLLHHGFCYLSDELSPIDPESLLVSSYPRALSLKRPLTESYPLPADAVDAGRTVHVFVRHLPARAIMEPRPLGAVLLLERRPELKAPSRRALGAAEASARLYVNTLNALAHPNHGLDAVVRIAQHVPCFAIAASELASTCALISSTVAEVCVAGS